MAFEITGQGNLFFLKIRTNLPSVAVMIGALQVQIWLHSL